MGSISPNDINQTYKMASFNEKIDKVIFFLPAREAATCECTAEFRFLNCRYLMGVE